MRRFPHYLQLDAMDCGPTCLRMIAKYYGKSYSLETLRSRSFITREGVSMLGISDAAESIGFRTSGVRISLKQLKEDMPLPCILHWNQNHFVVCYAIITYSFNFTIINTGLSTSSSSPSMIFTSLSLRTGDFTSAFFRCSKSTFRRSSAGIMAIHSLLPL